MDFLVVVADDDISGEGICCDLMLLQNGLLNSKWMQRAEVMAAVPCLLMVEIYRVCLRSKEEILADEHHTGDSFFSFQANLSDRARSSGLLRREPSCRGPGSGLVCCIAFGAVSARSNAMVLLPVNGALVSNVLRLNLTVLARSGDCCSGSEYVLLRFLLSRTAGCEETYADRVARPSYVARERDRRLRLVGGGFAGVIPMSLLTRRVAVVTISLGWVCMIFE